jgi:uncharacterized protein (TIGR03437 family)
VDGSTPAAGQASVPGSVGVAGNTPLVTAGGVVQAASDAAGVPISPGSLVTIYGLNLADSNAAAPSLPLQTQLNNVQVFLGNQPLPVAYTSTGQLNVQIPFSVPVNTQYQLSVQRDNVLSVPQTLVIAAAQPGIFTTNQAGSGQGVIFHSDLVTLAQAGTPVHVGDTIVIYCTGLGAVTPAVAAGAPAPVPAAVTVNPVTVQIGGVTAATPSFSGLTPGSTGLYQVNVVIPAGVQTGNSVPVTLTIAGQTSPPVTIAVQ